MAQNVEINGLNPNALGTITYPLAVTQAPKTPNQSIIVLNGTITVNSTSTVANALKTPAGTSYTVTAGKTFYMTDISVCNNNTTAVQFAITPTSSNTNPICLGHTLNTSPFEMTNIGSEPAIAGGSSPNMQVTGASATATSIAYTIYGYEQ